MPYLNVSISSFFLSRIFPFPTNIYYFFFICLKGREVRTNEMNETKTLQRTLEHRNAEELLFNVSFCFIISYFYHYAEYSEITLVDLYRPKRREELEQTKRKKKKTYPLKFSAKKDKSNEEKPLKDLLHADYFQKNFKKGNYCI